MTRPEVLRNMLLLTLASVLTACSGEKHGAATSADSSSPAAEQDACAFLTAEAISSQVGKAVGEGRKTNEAGGGKGKSRMTTCTWEAQASAAGASPAEMMRNNLAVSLILWSYASAERGTHYLESFRKVAKETGQPEPTPVSVGDEAIVDGTSVHVRQGKNAFTVMVQVFGDADRTAARTAAEALAGQVSAKL